MAAIATVSGEVEGEELGHVLPHEHVFINLLREYRRTGLLNDFDTARHELRAFAEAGGGTIVDVTTAELTAGASPDPLGIYGGTRSTGYPVDGSRMPNNVLDLRRLSQETGVRIVVGTGHYRDPYLDTDFTDRLGVDGVAERMVRDLVEGIPGTDGVRAGVIGEIAADKWYVSSAEERSFRSAARASVTTGAAITTHAARWPVGLAQLDILESEGVDPGQVIIGHCDTVHLPAYHLDVARRGAYVQFDSIWANEQSKLDRCAGYVRNLAEHGYLDRVLVSHDICLTRYLRANGGSGYTLVATDFSAALRRAGCTDAEVTQILVDNPRNALCG